MNIIIASSKIVLPKMKFSSEKYGVLKYRDEGLHYALLLLDHCHSNCNLYVLKEIDHLC